MKPRTGYICHCQKSWRRQLSAADKRLPRRAARFGLLWQNREAERLQVLAKLLHRLKTNSANSGRARLFQIYVPVVNEQGFGWLDSECVNAMLINLRFGLHAAHFTGKDVMVEIANPLEIVSHVRSHVGRHVG